MRVVHVAWESPPLFRYGGLSTFIENLARAEARLGLDVIVVGCTPCCAPLPRWGEGPGYRVLQACTVYDLQRRNVGLIQRELAVNAAGVIASADHLVVHDMHPYTAPLHAGEDALVTAYIHTPTAAPEEHLLLTLAGDVAANSHLTAGVVGQVAAAAHLNANRAWIGREEPPPVRVVHPAAPEPPEGWEPPGEPHPAVEALRREGYRRVAVAVTRRQHNKGVETLEGAARLLRGEAVAFIVAGRGWDRARRGNILYLGEVGEEEKWALLHSADIAVYPSDWEPFGLAALEAAMLGRPVIISDRVGAGEVLRSAPRFRAGDPQSLAEALRRLLGDGDPERLGERLAREARARTWAQVARELHSPLL